MNEKTVDSLDQRPDDQNRLLSLIRLISALNPVLLGYRELSIPLIDRDTGANSVSYLLPTITGLQPVENGLGQYTLAYLVVFEVGLTIPVITPCIKMPVFLEISLTM